MGPNVEYRSNYNTATVSMYVSKYEFSLPPLEFDIPALVLQRDRLENVTSRTKYLSSFFLDSS